MEIQIFKVKKKKHLVSGMSTFEDENKVSEWCYFGVSSNSKLIQIWKFDYMFGFISKQCPENFAFWILRSLELFYP